MAIAIVVVAWLAIGFWGWIFYVRTQMDVDSYLLRICIVGSVVGIISWFVFLGGLLFREEENAKIWFKRFGGAK